MPTAFRSSIASVLGSKKETTLVGSMTKAFNRVERCDDPMDPIWDLVGIWGAKASTVERIKGTSMERSFMVERMFSCWVGFVGCGLK